MITTNNISKKIKPLASIYINLYIAAKQNQSPKSKVKAKTLKSQGADLFWRFFCDFIFSSFCFFHHEKRRKCRKSGLVFSPTSFFQVFSRISPKNQRFHKISMKFQRYLHKIWKFKNLKSTEKHRKAKKSKESRHWTYQELAARPAANPPTPPAIF